ncbi:MAG: hypothetical protein IJ741_02905 [Schwartzia sp.]|nr:hypothetical protein [Schwartzia sp. (in: firmicutes)]
MKKYRFAGLFVAAFILTLAITAVAFAGQRGSQDFVLENGTGRIITEIYLSPTSTKEWIYQDELGKNQVLYPGQEIFLGFDPKDNVQYWDIMVVYDDNTYDYWNALDLFRIYRVTIRPNGLVSIDAA